MATNWQEALSCCLAGAEDQRTGLTRPLKQACLLMPADLSKREMMWKKEAVKKKGLLGLTVIGS